MGIHRKYVILSKIIPCLLIFFIFAYKKKGRRGSQNLCGPNGPLGPRGPLAKTIFPGRQSLFLAALWFYVVVSFLFFFSYLCPFSFVLSLLFFVPSFSTTACAHRAGLERSLLDEEAIIYDLNVNMRFSVNAKNRPDSSFNISFGNSAFKHSMLNLIKRVEPDTPQVGSSDKIDQFFKLS